MVKEFSAAKTRRPEEKNYHEALEGLEEERSKNIHLQGQRLNERQIQLTWTAAGPTTENLCYLIQRQCGDPPADNDAAWQPVAAAYRETATLDTPACESPTAYRVLAVNAHGHSQPADSVAAL